METNKATRDIQMRPQKRTASQQIIKEPRHRTGLEKVTEKLFIVLLSYHATCSNGGGYGPVDLANGDRSNYVGVVKLKQLAVLPGSCNHTSGGGGFGGALHLEPVQQLLLRRRRVVHGEHNLAGLSDLEAPLHDRLLMGWHFPRLLHDHGVAALGVRGEFSTIAHLPSQHAELPHHGGVLQIKDGD